jgi:putative DNA primase/helicase
MSVSPSGSNSRPSASVAPAQRFTPQSPCPVCGGHQRMPQGRGQRCWGFLSDDSQWAHCTREEYAGSIQRNHASTFAHRLTGKCPCGVFHSGQALSSRKRRSPARKRSPGKVVGETSYQLKDTHGEAVAVHHRTDFEDGSKKITWERNGESNLGGLPTRDLPLYGVQHLAGSVPSDPIVVCEGEKACDALTKRGVLAVATVCGARTVPSDETLQPLLEHAVILWVDNDDDGRHHMKNIAEALVRLGAKTVRLIDWAEAPNKGDAADFDGPDEELAKLIDEAQPINFSGQATWESFQGLLGPIEWDWDRWLPRGFLVLLAGDPGCGKSGFALHIAATYIRGDPWPDGTKFTGETGVVVWCESESAQALNFERAQAWDLPLEKIMSPFENLLLDVRLDNQEHREALEKAANRPDVRLIVIDSLRGAVGGNENDSEFSGVPMWLAGLARDTGTVILVTHHLRKRAAGETSSVVTIDRLRGSSAIAQPARLIMAIDSPNANSPERRRLSVIKSNLGKFPPPLGLRIDERGVQFGDAPAPVTKKTQVDGAAVFLRNILRDGPMLAKDVYAEAASAGFSKSSVGRAKTKYGFITAKGTEGRWRWSMPEPDED